MSAERDKMIAALREHVVPELKSRGFSGSFPHFRRLSNTAIRLLTFQFDRSGGGFVVEIAVCPASDLTNGAGEPIAPARINVWDIVGSQRYRLGSVNHNGDHWFRYDCGGFSWFGDPYKKLAQRVLLHMDEAESYWEKAEVELRRGF